jgi:hypothetical protein
VGKAQSLFHGNVPSTRHVRVLNINKIGEHWRPRDGNDFITSATWWKDSIGWNLWKRRVAASGDVYWIP